MVQNTYCIIMHKYIMKKQVFDLGFFHILLVTECTGKRTSDCDIAVSFTVTLPSISVNSKFNQVYYFCIKLVPTLVQAPIHSKYIYMHVQIQIQLPTSSVLCMHLVIVEHTHNCVEMPCIVK